MKGRQKRSIQMLSLHLSLPSILTCIPCPFTAFIQSGDVYWLPWSVFIISGAPYLDTHSSKSSVQLDFSNISTFVSLSLFFIVKGASVSLHETTVSVSAQACWALAFEPSYFLFRPAASQASAKKSTSIVNWPTFLSSLSFSAFRLFSSLLSECSSPNTDPDFSRNSFFQSVICLGATPYFLASSDRVSFSFNASRTTFVLNAVKLAFSSHIFLDLLQRYAFYVPLVLSKFWGVLY